MVEAPAGPVTGASPTPRRRVYAVWELTLACNLRCLHCGSRAGSARPAELGTDQALDVVRQLAEVGVDEVTLIGGEAWLRRDWDLIAAEIVRRHMTCTLTTGGYRVSERLAQRMRDCGITQCTVSVDGMRAAHDTQRGRDGSWASCFDTLARVRAVGVAVACNTQLNRLTVVDLPELYMELVAHGVRDWQLQLTVPMGRAADNHHILVQPDELPVVFDTLSRIARRAAADGVHVVAGNNVGYHGPDEALLRGGGTGAVWQGCQAGLSTLGVEADGTIKGCPSLPTAEYRGGSFRELPLADVIRDAPELGFNLVAGTADARRDLWGFCATCEHATTCRGGCAWTAHSLLGRRGNNPWCHHRVLTLQGRGLRERLVPLKPAPGLSFDHGEFALVEEPCSHPWPVEDALRLTADRVRWPAGWRDSPALPSRRAPRRMRLSR